MEYQSNWIAPSQQTGIIPPEQIDNDIIGSEEGFWGPFGWRKYIYLDHTATGKALKSIEGFIEGKVLPHYANTHTTVSHTASQTTIFRDEAREIVRESVGASRDDDEVIFCGAGATSAVHKLLHHLTYPKHKKLVAFVGPFEHHSNLLPWREAATKIIQVPMNLSTGYVDLHFLEKNLKKVARRSKEKGSLIVGCFSAGSNVTGVLTDDVKITELMHEYGGIAVWDYAAAAPHVPIDMNPGGKYNPGVNKDALFFSGHKFLGGPQTPGVLVVKKHIFQNPVPHGVGGGTVLYATCRKQKYIPIFHEREEGGTPDIIGSIRLGLVFSVRNAVGIEEIMEREARYCGEILNAFAELPEIHILGSECNPRLPIISFMIKHLESGYYLHHNFVVALLNDLFGIQCRGGCMCAGPYGEVLLGVDGRIIEKFFDYEYSRDTNKPKFSTILKPGFVRIAAKFHNSPEEIDFLIEAVKLIAKHGWKLLPFYRVCLESGSFIFHEKLAQQHQKTQVRFTSLHSFTLSPCLAKDDPLKLKPYYEPNETFGSTLRNCLIKAEKIVDTLLELLNHLQTPLQKQFEISVHPKPQSPYTTVEKKSEKLRWFMTQRESLFYIRNQPSLHDSKMALSIKFNPLKLLSPVGGMDWREGSIPKIVSRFWYTLPRPLGDHQDQDQEGEIFLADDWVHWDSLYSNFRFTNANFWPAKSSRLEVKRNSISNKIV